MNFTRQCALRQRKRKSLPFLLTYYSILYSGLLISGGFPWNSVGTSVEVFVPSTGQHCQLPELLDKRYYHSMEQMTVCGGYETDAGTSCLSLTADGTWENTTTLLERR